MFSRSVIFLKSEAGRKAAAVSFSLRVSILVLLVSPLDEKLLPFSVSSVCDSYSSGGKCGITRVTRYILHMNTKLRMYRITLTLLIN